MLIHVDHPLISTELTRIRDPLCSSQEFRERVRRIASLMVFRVTQDLDRVSTPCQTPLEFTEGESLVRPIVLVPILRAGLGFLDGFLDLIPQAKVGHIGLARNEDTLLPETYLFKHPPDLELSDIILLDPMLATGGSLLEAVRILKKAGAQRIRIACLLAAPEGIASLTNTCPEIDIYTASVDRCLNDQGYILPGLGDAGDRIFSTL